MAKQVLTKWEDKYIYYQYQKHKVKNIQYKLCRRTIVLARIYKMIL